MKTALKIIGVLALIAILHNALGGYFEWVGTCILIAWFFISEK